MITDLYRPFWQTLWDCSCDPEHVEYLKQATHDRLIDPNQGDFFRWLQAYQSLPDIDSVAHQKQQSAITCQANIDHQQQQLVKGAYQGLIPWRKGPFDMFSVFIDAEWQSNMKWQRIEKHLPPLMNRLVLDVGCGNGYYLFRMSEASPRLLMGIDPGILQTMQFWSIEKYRRSGACVLPLSMEKMPPKMSYFDVVFSMGVLYHRKSPIHHLTELYDILRSKGHVIMETLVVKGDENACFIPSGRYAQMRNVWFLPSVDCLKVMLKRVGFVDIKCVDVTTTTTEEQRQTEWMKFHSLANFLDHEQQKTIEGYDLPTRATIIARKP